MSIDKTDQATPATPLLKTLGDPDAAVCVDGFCEVPAAQVGTGSVGTGSASTAETTNTTQGADE